MDPLLVAVTALAVSIATIPVMIRLAPRFRLLDKPNARKIHSRPIPRVGGWGICLGTLIAVLVWLNLATVTVSFVIGGIVILISGALDDMLDIPAMTKLGLQFVATFPAVTIGAIGISSLPLFGTYIQLPPVPTILFSWVALVICVNATNTSDGLDGLAAGATLLSLSGIAYLGYLTGSSEFLLLTAASIGGLLGFFRFNTHPAIIFMGDLGSQFLGFAVGFLSLAMVQANQATISPWVVLFLTGLPTADIVVVALRRVLRGINPMRADKTHFHHRLMAVGLTHNQSVIMVYVLQATFVFFGVALYASSSANILITYLLYVSAIYGLLTLVEIGVGKQFISRLRDPHVARSSKPPHPLLLWGPRLALDILVPIILVAGALLVHSVPADFGILGAALMIPLVLGLLRRSTRSAYLTRIPVFVIATAVLYLYTNGARDEMGLSQQLEIGTMTTLGLLAVIAVKFSPKRRKEEFRANAIDYLLVVFAVLAILSLKAIPRLFNPHFLVYLPVILYCCELLMVERRQRTNWLPPAAVVAAATLAVRGLMS